MKDHNNIDCKYTSEIVCPYCGHEHRDSWDYGIDGNEEIECRSETCGKRFYVESVTTVEYVSERIEDRTVEGRAARVAALTKQLDDLLK